MTPTDLGEINARPGTREYLETQHGQVWDTDQLREEFDVLGFAAPLIVVRRRSDGVKGSLMFQYSPRRGPSPRIVVRAS
jgi:hypothetical protein